MVVYGLIFVIVLLIILLSITAKSLYKETVELHEDLSYAYGDIIQLQTIIDFYKATSLKPDADEFDYDEMNSIIKMLNVVSYDEDINEDVEQINK